MLFSTFDTGVEGNSKKMKEIYESFKQNLAYLRKSQGWTQEDLAQKLGIKRTVVASYEAGNTLPKFNILLEIRKVFNVSLERLLLTKNPKELFISEAQEKENDKQRIKELQEEVIKLQKELIESRESEEKVLEEQTQLKNQVNDLSLKLNDVQAQLLEFYKNK